MPNDNPPHSDKRPQDLRSTLTKRQILDGARQVFLLNGYAGTSIDQIVNQSGVSKDRSITTSTARMCCSDR
ncbi:helix-turn-helix transcriptional regulator [Microvirga sp. BT689]|uniref:TetR/AcrR family transcriptional regulator n=1 Tax=Microvirga arvi TaxID=2778731 RepID=UPI00194E0AB0|nr:TetR/AcrR family transcriptional regulator [Microvirga arvi]MBM6582960.1 helix-turn-helix transcriptional regulator [Microvirga arvi]